MRRVLTERGGSPNGEGTGQGWAALRPYVQIARIDHWFKNVFMLLGIALAFFYRPELLTWSSLPWLVVAFASACLVASSNYVLNEVADAPLDRLHPTKRHRPAAMGLVNEKLAMVEWLVLAAAGLGLAFWVNALLGASALVLWLMAIAYNVRPIRTKDIPYIDVLTESINNPLRLLMGWYALIPEGMPRASLLIAYWMGGAFFMATKRLAEYRQIDDKEVAARYRRSFSTYDQSSLLVSIMFYASSCSLFSGIFIVRYKIELILAVPVVAGFFAAYLHLGLQPDSPVQNPEKLYRVRWFFLYALFTTALFLALMLVEIPDLWTLFDVEPATVPPVWRWSG